MKREKVGVFRFDFPERKDLSSPVLDEEYGKRLDRLQRVLSIVKEKVDDNQSITLMGMSLGADLIMDLINTLSYKVSIILIGSVIFEEIHIPAFIESVSLIYGSEDYISLEEEVTMESLIKPETYGVDSLNNIEWGKDPALVILKGLGHSLDVNQLEYDDPVKALSDLILRRELRESKCKEI
ncbi:hypothetical protein PQ478_19610 [Alkalihalophilus pseudofirmus]|uniref:hypothetical protein n=1 Tax=Alkalihalophilus pseudofirmus TaxID=79885 RepID=UPI00259BD442|nr:hypothetical protein [Alkalihalophilus pseudofirmus]WEG16686.1 hypothetical protein PQ478_19610 [Alkalihalophilus pseudofirmus]